MRTAARISLRAWPALLAPVALTAALVMFGPAAGSDRARTPSAVGRAGDVTVTVDLARSLPHTRSVIGLLHGLEASAPASRWIDPLRPALWRGNLFSAPFTRATQDGARYMLVVSDLWGYPGEGWRGRGPPWADPEAWRTFIRGLAASAPTGDIVWDVWNEPDQRYFWDGTRRQYLTTFAIAAREIRSVLGPSARIAGPSVSAFRPDWLRSLTRFCAAERYRLDMLTWHELPAGRTSIARIDDHLRLARRGILESPDLARAGLREIVINEVVGGGDQLLPGELAGYFSVLERGGADAAALACWRDPCGIDNCTRPSLDGLLDPRTLEPRATWWVAKAYADGVGARVWSGSSRSYLVALATRCSRDGAHVEVLLGYFDPHDRPVPERIDVGVVLRGVDLAPMLRGADRLLVRSRRFAAAGEDPATPLTCRLPKLVAVKRGSAALTVRGVGLHEAVLLSFSPTRGGQGR